MKKTKVKKSSLTEAERHKRFIEMARKVEASEDPKDFDKAFKKVVSPKGKNNQGSQDQKK